MGEQDSMTLMAECKAPPPDLVEAVAATLQAVTKLKGDVKIVAPGTLPNDGKVREQAWSFWWRWPLAPASQPVHLTTARSWCAKRRARSTWPGSLA
jgi:hypothetical protein